MIGVFAMKMPSHAIAPGAGRQAFSCFVVPYAGAWTIVSVQISKSFLEALSQVILSNFSQVILSDSEESRSGHEGRYLKERRDSSPLLCCTAK